MPSQTVAVGSRSGLRARSAERIAAAVGMAGVPVTISMPGGTPVDAASAAMIRTLRAERGADIVLTSEDQTVLERIAGLVAEDIDAQ